MKVQAQFGPDLKGLNFLDLWEIEAWKRERSGHLRSGPLGQGFVRVTGCGQPEPDLKLSDAV